VERLEERGFSVDPKLDALARAAPNFGYLLTHEPLLVSYGAAAEAAVYTNPNMGMNGQTALVQVATP
jgi:hypothetical protein